MNKSIKTFHDYDGNVVCAKMTAHNVGVLVGGKLEIIVIADGDETLNPSKRYLFELVGNETPAARASIVSAANTDIPPSLIQQVCDWTYIQEWEWIGVRPC
jgi:hypothetical protein